MIAKVAEAVAFFLPSVLKSAATSLKQYEKHLRPMEALYLQKQQFDIRRLPVRVLPGNIIILFNSIKIYI